MDGEGGGRGWRVGMRRRRGGCGGEVGGGGWRGERGGGEWEGVNGVFFLGLCVLLVWLSHLAGRVFSFLLSF